MGILLYKYGLRMGLEEDIRAEQDALSFCLVRKTRMKMAPFHSETETEIYWS